MFEVSDNIVLVGFMGVGKGRTARSLARKTSRFAVDTDDLVESYANRSVKKIFKQRGEEHFRHLERKTALWLEQNVHGSIISTGGGFVQVPNIRQIGRIVYLHSRFDAIVQTILDHPNSVKKIRKRPLLKDLHKAELLYKKRLPLYRSLACLEINIENKDIDAVSDEICEKVTALYVEMNP